MSIINPTPGGRSATLVVAAYDASTASYDSADYQCNTGGNDMDVIYQAINALPSAGGRIVLTEGTFRRQYPLAIDKSYVTIEGQGDSTVIVPQSNAIGPAHIIVGSNGAYDGVTGLTGYSLPATSPLPTEIFMRNFRISDWSSASPGSPTTGSSGGIFVRLPVVRISDVNISDVATDAIRHEAFRHTPGTAYTLSGSAGNNAPAWSTTAQTWTVTASGATSGFYLVQPPTSGYNYDAEMIYASVSGTTWTVLRGACNTNIQDAPSGSRLFSVGLAVNFNCITENCQISAPLRAGLVAANGMDDSEWIACNIAGGSGLGAEAYTPQGIWTGGGGLRFIDCHPWFCSDYGLYGGFQWAGFTAPTFSVIGGEYESNGISGIYVNCGSGVTVTGGTSFYTNGVNDISLASTNNFSIGDNWMYSGGSDQELTNHVLLTDCNQGAVHDNVMTGIVSGPMIEVTGQNDYQQNEINIHDNVLGTSGGSYETAISIAGGATLVNVHDNNTEAGIVESGAGTNSNYIHDNVMASAGGSGYTSVTIVGADSFSKDNFQPGVLPAVNETVAAAASPGGTTSTTLQMCGLGQQLTPSGSGMVLVIATGQCTLSASGANNQVEGRYGTGSVPSHGGALAGNQWGGSSTPTLKGTGTTAESVQFAFTDLLNLTLGTTYWFDLAQATTAGAETAYLTNVKLVAVEPAAS